MKAFSKVFFIAFICFFLAISVGAYSYVKEKNIKIESEFTEEFKNNRMNLSRAITQTLEVKPKDPVVYSSLKEALKESNRINFIILGLEDIRTDTMIFASFCPDTKKVSLVNIPRDTYIHRKGYNEAEQRKINSIYGDHGVVGVKKTITHILNNVPIHHYITMDYEGVKNIIDGLGGVEVDVPFHMIYEDHTATPPLYINIPPGKQMLNGKKSLDFLRYRKGNYNRGGYIDGDLGRIKAQQDFIKSFIDKASDNLLTTITKGFSHVKADVSLMETLAYGRKALGIGKDDFEILTLPGEAEFRKIGKKVLSYYIYDKRETEKLLEKIYNVKQQ